jgi:hypothetical protein
MVNEPMLRINRGVNSSVVDKIIAAKPDVLIRASAHLILSNQRPGHETVYHIQLLYSVLKRKIQAEMGWAQITPINL